MATVQELAQAQAHQGERLDALQGDVHAIRKALSDLATGFADIRSALKTQEATRPPGFGEMIQQVRDVAAIVMLAAAAIVYVVNATGGAEQATTRREISQLTDDLRTRRAAEHDELRTLRDRYRIIVPVMPRGPQS